VGGEKYILNFVNDLSGMTWSYVIKEKSQAEKVFIKWHVLVENETSQKKTSIFKWKMGGNSPQNSLRATYVNKGFNTN